MQNTLDLKIAVYAPTVYRAAYALTRNRQDAEDVMQETFLRYARHTAPFKDEQHEKAWLIRVAINRAKSLLGRAWKQKEIGEVPAYYLAPVTEVGRNSVVDAVLSLPPKQRITVHLHYYEDKSVKEIARITGMPEGSVKSHLSRARATLKKTLLQEVEE